ncbi:MAG: exopolysaccharide Pel transporter PelG [Deltaproteobacteria bacterium]|nr:exopolysaccharide Pel transporter PelG [Kofleriaceae bacterium]
MMERDSLSGSLGAFLTGVAVTSGPWLLTTLVLVLVRISAARSGTLAVQEVEQVITVVYATVIVLSAPIDIVLSRYAADRVYEKRRDQIAAPLRTTVSVCLVGFLVIGGAAMLLAGFPRELAIPGAVLASIVAAQWLLLSAAGGLSSPGIIVRAFAAGAPLSIAGAYLLSRWEVFGATGYLYGYGLGQLLTLALLLHGTMRALPEEEDEDARVGSAFREYWMLAAAAFCFHAGLWIDKVILYVTGVAGAPIYAACAAVAWLTVIPAAAFLFVTIETTFHRRFRAYYAALHAGASLRELERLVSELRAEVEETLRGTSAVQAGVTLIAVMSAPAIVGALSLHADHSITLAWLLVGAGLQVVAVSTTLLLYYFDFRREAFATAATQLVANGLLTFAVGTDSRALGLGYTAACALTCIVSLVLLRRRMEGLLGRTFQSQPFASEDGALELGHV